MTARDSLTTRARKEKKGTPQGAPISPLLRNIYMRRCMLAWNVLGYAHRFRAKVVHYADDFVILGKTDAAVMLKSVEDLMRRLKLPINGRPDASDVRRSRSCFLDIG